MRSTNSRVKVAKCDEGLIRVFSLLGKPWTGMIIGVLLEGPQRFVELSRTVPGITDAMLSTRLTELRNARLVTRQIIEGPPMATLYSLTEQGEELRAPLSSLSQWARRYLRRTRV